MLIDFTKIKTSFPSPSGRIPVIRADSDDNSGERQVWDSVWGYVTVSQTISFNYEKESKYRTFGDVTINGVFTINAVLAESDPESGVVEPDASKDEERFNLIKARYETLRNMFSEAGKKSAPEDVSKYGTSEDERCVELPSSMLAVNPEDENGEGIPVYMKPVSLNISESQWPVMIKYTASLREIPHVPCKLTVNGHTIDRAVIRIQAKKPVLKTQEYMFSSSCDMFFSGWQSRKYSIQGTISGTVAEGKSVPVNAKKFINSIMSGKLEVSRKSRDSGDDVYVDGKLQSILPELFVDSSSVQVDHENDGKGVKVSFTARE
jgi:hypothetical protein